MKHTVPCVDAIAKLKQIERWFHAASPRAPHWTTRDRFEEIGEQIHRIRMDLDRWTHHPPPSRVDAHNRIYSANEPSP